MFAGNSCAGALFDCANHEQSHEISWLGAVQKRYGLARDEAERQMEKFESLNETRQS